jgi:hypothetical protein
MKEVLETCCRELDVNDISEVQPSIAKLKAVVKAVPRMERFISTTCNYVFQRAQDSPLVPTKPTMEDVIPVLKSWHDRQSKGAEYEKFFRKINGELGRREAILSEGGAADVPAAGRAGGPGPPRWSEEGVQKWTGASKTPESAVELIREIVDFQLEVMRHKNSFRAAEEFIREHPEAMTNRIISHVQYLFEIKALDGFLPRINQVYLFYNEMRNFISAAKSQMNLAKGETDAATIAQLQRVLAKLYNN